MKAQQLAAQSLLSVALSHNRRIKLTLANRKPVVAAQRQRTVMSAAAADHNKSHMLHAIDRMIRIGEFTVLSELRSQLIGSVKLHFDRTSDQIRSRQYRADPIHFR